MLTVPSKSVAGRVTFSRGVPNAVNAAASNVVVSVIALPLLPDEHEAVRRTGHRAADVDQMPLRIDLLHAEIDLCVSRRAGVARHALSLDHARRVGTGAHRARLP